MNRTRVVGRVAAVISSVALLSGYVAYRGCSQTGAGKTADASPKVMTQDDHFVGTKSGPVFSPPTYEQKKFIGGSKSAAMVYPEDLVTDPTVKVPPGKPTSQPPHPKE